MRRPVRIAITGAAGAISNSLLFQIADGTGPAENSKYLNTNRVL